MDPAVPTRAGSRGHSWTRQVVPGLLVPVATAVVAAAGLRVSGLGVIDAFGFALAIAWAIAGLVIARSADRTAAPLIGLGALAGTVGLTAARIGASEGDARGPARVLATLAACGVIAVSFHYLLALPDGRLGRPGRRVMAALGYASAAGTGIGLAVAGQPFTVTAGAVIWPLAVACALPATRLRYLQTAGRDKERLQWLGAGLVIAASVALTSAVLHLLVDWPGPADAVAAGAALVVPLAVIAAEFAPLARHGGQVLVQALAVAGSGAIVAAIYLVIVLGLGNAPGDPEDRRILGMSMLAAAVAVIGFLPARGRLVASATRFVYGTREAPGESLRTFGSRMTRAVAMDELLLQLAESLRKTMQLTCAEIYTGLGDVLERAVSVPDADPKSIVLTDRERPVVARAGVSGSAWASVWLPALLDGREQAQLRVAPISHAGELLGLIVVERPARADTFTEEDDRVLTELARQAGLAFHNSQLDSALQTTLDALRKQADELRESRARVVASGDAERRRVERNLHDGAQQHLVALAINLRLTRDIVAEDPEGAGEMLGQLAEDVQTTIKELRELAHGIYPPLLADNGLGDALRAAASRSPLTVRLAVADEVGRYSAELEAAIYFACMEALQNAAKHAEGATVDLRLWTESGGLLFSVADDGPGYDAAVARRGHGYINMADRLGAIGGTVRWDSSPGHGSSVSGSVPLVA
jgi:signal transduction histidine kinase